MNGNPLAPEALNHEYLRISKSTQSVLSHCLGYRRPSLIDRDPRAQSALWLAGKTLAEATPRRALWDRCWLVPSSGTFSMYFRASAQHADFKRLYPSFSQRVWNVLEAAGEDDRLRRSLFSIAYRLDQRRWLLPALFSEMEVQVLCFRAMAAATLTFGGTGAAVHQSDQRAVPPARGGGIGPG